MDRRLRKPAGLSSVITGADYRSESSRKGGPRLLPPSSVEVVRSAPRVSSPSPPAFVPSPPPRSPPCRRPRVTRDRVFFPLDVPQHLAVHNSLEAECKTGPLSFSSSSSFLLFSSKPRWSKTTPYHAHHVITRRRHLSGEKRSRLANRRRTARPPAKDSRTISSSSCNIQAEWAHRRSLHLALATN